MFYIPFPTPHLRCFQPNLIQVFGCLILIWKWNVWNGHRKIWTNIYIYNQSWSSGCTSERNWNWKLMFLVLSVLSLFHPTHSGAGKNHWHQSCKMSRVIWYDMQFCKIRFWEDLEQSWEELESHGILFPFLSLSAFSHQPSKDFSSRNFPEYISDFPWINFWIF